LRRLQGLLNQALIAQEDVDVAQKKKKLEEEKN
jgi:hypothetical protein